MIYTDSLLDRRMLTTDTNEYATGFDDENLWEEYLDDDTSEYLDDEPYNEAELARERIY